MKMSTDARKVINKLIELTGSEEVATVHNVLVAETLCYSFYAKTIMGHMSRFYNPDSKGDPTDMMFYVKPIRSINKGRRNKEIWASVLVEEEAGKYQLVGDYVSTDYNNEALKQVREIMDTYSEDEIRSAIKISGEADVYSVPFLYRVLESERAERIRIAERRERQRKAQEESRRGIYAGQGVKRTPIDVANLAMSWEETINTMKLEKLLKENDREHSNDI